MPAVSGQADGRACVGHQLARGVDIMGVGVGAAHRPAAVSGALVSIKDARLAEIGAVMIWRIIRQKHMQRGLRRILVGVAGVERFGDRANKRHQPPHDDIAATAKI